MATKFSPQLPISTKVLNFLRDVGALLVLCLLGNPVSMFCLNMVFPSLAAKFAHNSLIFSEEVCAFYTKRALKLPYYWAMWWIDKKNLPQYSANEQIEYYFNVDDSESTLFAMSTQAVKALIQGYPQVFEYIAENSGRLRDEMFEEIINRATKRLPFWRDVLEKRLKQGTLTKCQVTLLVEKAIEENHSASESQFIERCLCCYVKRCGLNDVLEKRIENCVSRGKFRNNVLDSLSQYKQKCTVRSLADLSNATTVEKWQDYCKNNSIGYDAQKEMTVEQYKIFHLAGKRLIDDVIAQFIKKGDENMISLINQYEPKINVIKAKMKILDLS
ncbi:MAG: hypothetical protein IJ778_02995 [Alphaproteobacteria bacterium]|nr:hypothetical protein [Alphaproteobacteria bacterium]